MTSNTDNGDVPATKADIERLHRRMEFVAISIGGILCVVLALTVNEYAAGALISASALWAVFNDGINRRFWTRAARGSIWNWNLPGGETP